MQRGSGGFGRPWAPWAVRYLADRWEYDTDEQIAEVVGRTPGGVKDMRSKMGFKRMPSNKERIAMKEKIPVVLTDVRTPLNMKWVSERQMRKTDKRLT